MAVLFHRRTASGSIDDDCVYVGRFKGGDHLASEMRCLILEAGMDHKGPTTRLRLRDDNFTAFGGKYSDCGLVDVLKEHLLDTTGEHANTAPGRGGGGDIGWQTFEISW